MNQAVRGRISRRKLLKAAAGAAVVTMGGGALDALAIEPYWIKVTRPVIGIDGLPKAWDGVRIAHLTDLHVGQFVSLDYARKVVALTNAESPDLVVMTGDFVYGSEALTPELAGVLADLRSGEGKFAVLGNHDYWTDVAGVSALLSDAGISLLTNRGVVLARRGEQFCLAGVDDLWEGRPALETALKGVEHAVPRVLLCHNPDYAERMPPDPRVDLMLCGHTHGGQVKIPFGPRPMLPVRHTRYAAGLAPGPCCNVYTSCGLGMTGIPVRLNCRPELAAITLRRQAPET